ncbi:hypothetical protein ANN_01815 [Periplaneta americana]|uniref:Uncharacterized protein n=1 Tax=Periplaneta americana TaxID=6978 RepID=A0ABQ8TWZ0_PERAM|nr:hypothetical protein ANN_01815 [Periplaneta americana]
MSPEFSAESYLAFARNGLRKNPEINLNQSESPSFTTIQNNRTARTFTPYIPMSKYYYSRKGPEISVDRVWKSNRDIVVLLLNQLLYLNCDRTRALLIRSQILLILLYSTSSFCDLRRRLFRRIPANYGLSKTTSDLTNSAFSMLPWQPFKSTNHERRVTMIFRQQTG